MKNETEKALSHPPSILQGGPTAAEKAENRATQAISGLKYLRAKSALYRISNAALAAVRDIEGQDNGTSD